VKLAILTIYFVFVEEGGEEGGRKERREDKLPFLKYKIKRTTPLYKIKRDNIDIMYNNK